MNARSRTVLAGLAAGALAAPGLAQTSAVSGGQSGYDRSLEAIEPRDEPVSVGLAGEDPAGVGRYVMAANGGARSGRLSPDGRKVASRWSISGEPQLWVVDAEGGQPVRLTYGDGIRFFRWSPDSRTILYGADDAGDEQEEGGYSRLSVRDRTANRAIGAPELPEGVYGVSCGDGSDRIPIEVEGWRTPGSLVLWNVAEGAVRDTFAAGLAGLDRDRLVRPEDVRIPARDGVELQGLLYLPDPASRRGAGLPPVLFFVHGGPTGQSRPTFVPIVQYHVDRGMAVFEPNVRGSTGFGHTYATLDDRENRLHSIRDLVDMLEWLEEDGRVDTSRAAVVGGSYGGYAVNAVLAGFPGAFAAGVSLYGVADWVSALELASSALKASDRIEYGDITEERWRDFYTVNSPIRQADRIDVTVLYSHGVRDPRVDIGETELMVRTLRERGVRAD